METEEGDYIISSDVGWALGLYHGKDFEGGRNFIQVFYGTGAAENGMAIITQPMGQVAPNSFADQTQGVSLGLQMEVWW